MKQIIILFSILAVLVSCERQEPQDVVSYAVVSGKKISSVTICYVINGLLYPMEYKYEYDEKGNIKTLNDSGVIYDYFYQDDLLVRITSDIRYWTLSYNEDKLLGEYVVYGGYSPLIMSFDYEDNRMTTVYEYQEFKDGPQSYTQDIIWEGQNIKGMNNVTYAYNNIIDNFNVPVVPLININGIDPMFNMFVRSENLVSKVFKKYKNYGGGEVIYQYDYSYIRNEEGDICRIDVTDGNTYMYYQIEYYD